MGASGSCHPPLSRLFLVSLSCGHAYVSTYPAVELSNLFGGSAGWLKLQGGLTIEDGVGESDALADDHRSAGGAALLKSSLGFLRDPSPTWRRIEYNRR